MSAFAAEARSTAPLRAAPTAAAATRAAPNETVRDAPRSPETHELAAVAEGRRGAPLEIGRIDDPLEHEADRAAARALSDQAAIEHAKTCSCGGSCPACRRAAQLQRAATGAPAATPDAAGVPGVLSRPGERFPASERAFFEPRLGADLSQVSVHTDADAARSAAAVGARAYTVGDELVFGAGEYAPATPSGRRLIAHELAHVLQQRAGAPALLRRQPPPASTTDEHAAPDEKVAPDKPEAPAPGELAEAPLAGTVAGSETVPGADAQPTQGGQGPTTAPDPCVPNRDLTWADFQGAVPGQSAFAAFTSAPISPPGTGGSTIFQARLDSSKSWVRPRYSDPTNRAATGCSGPVANCEKEFAKLKPGETATWSFDGKADPNCPAGEVPSSTPTAKAKGDCDSVIGAECDRAAGAESARLLRHEQLHFSISCAIAKKANAAVTAGTTVDAAKQAVAQKAPATQKAYDDQSNHGCIAAKQSSWETDVAGGLASVTIP